MAIPLSLSLSLYLALALCPSLSVLPTFQLVSERGGPCPAVWARYIFASKF